MSLSIPLFLLFGGFIAFVLAFVLAGVSGVLLGVRALLPGRWIAWLDGRPWLRGAGMFVLVAASVALFGRWGMGIYLWACTRFLVLVDPATLTPWESRAPYLNAIAQNRANALHTVAAVALVLLLAAFFTLAFRRLVRTNRSGSARTRAALVLAPVLVVMLGYIYVNIRLAFPDGVSFKLNNSVNVIFGGAGGAGGNDQDSRDLSQRSN